MKVLPRLLPCLFCVGVSTTLFAQIIPLSGSAGTWATGNVAIQPALGGQTDGYTHAQTAAVPYATFTGSVSGTAVANVTIPPPYQLLLGPTLHVESWATQDSTVSAAQISIQSQVFAGSWVNSQVGPLTSSARALTDITFRLDQPVNFVFTATGNQSQSDYPYTSRPTTVQLSQSGGPILLGGVYNQWLWGSSVSGSGILGPGTYNLLCDLGANALGDPLGESGQGQLTVSLRVSNVDDTATTCVLLLAGVAALGLRRRRCV